MTEAQPPESQEPIGTLVSGKTFILAAAGLFLVFGAFGMWLSNLRIKTKPAIDICNTIGIQLELTATETVQQCLNLPLSEAAPASFRAVDDPNGAFFIEGVRGEPSCTTNRAEFTYRFTSPCTEMARDFRLGVNLPLKTANSLRDDLGAGVQEACRAVLEMNCDCRKIRRIPAGIYETACRNIDEDRKKPGR